MLVQRMLFSFDDAISSAELPDGNSHSNSPDSRKISLSGQEVVLAGLSQLLERGEETQIQGTCGHPGLASSESANLNWCLANKCQRLLAMDGLTDCAPIWKQRATPLGLLFWEHIPSGLTTHDSDCTGVVRLPTPQCMDSKGYSQKLNRKYRKTGHLKHWVHGTLLAIHSATGVSSWPNPMLCEWMMGFPRLWISGRDYTPTETQ